MQAPVRFQHDIPGGYKCSGRTYAQPLFRADEINPVRIHAADGRHVKGHLRLTVFASRNRQGARVIVYVVGSRNDACLLCPDARVDFGRTCQDGQAVRPSCVQSLAVYAHRPLRHLQRPQAPVTAVLRPSRRQDGTTRIDEAAAVYTDAVGIGHNDRSRPAGHFHKSVEGRRAAGGHFVYDDLGGAAIHMGVTLHVPGKLRLRRRVRVVEDGASFGDVEVRVPVARHAACRRRRNLHQGHAVCRFLHQGLLRGGGLRVRHDGHVGKGGSRCRRRHQSRKKPYRNLPSQPLPSHLPPPPV